MSNRLSSNLGFAVLFCFRDGLGANMISTHQTVPPMKNKCSRAFTLIELIVVIATIIILAALAVPAFHSVYERAKVTKDMSNLRQIGAATQMYMNDNGGGLPGS